MPYFAPWRTRATRHLTVILIAVIDWDPESLPPPSSSIDSGSAIRKLRIRRRDLETTSPPARPTVCTVRDLRTCLRTSLPTRITTATTTDAANVANGRIDEREDKNYVKICVYDYTRNEYVLMQPEFDETLNLLSRFGSRIRVRISHLDVDRCSSSSNYIDRNRRQQNQPALLAITDRYYPFRGGVTVAGRQIRIQEIANLPGAGTGVTAWDGALLLARYLEVCSSNVRGCRVLELGAGWRCGVVGIAAAALGAQSVLMTDLPYVLPLLRSNMDSNQNLVTTDSSNCVISMECCECEWR